MRRMCATPGDEPAARFVDDAASEPGRTTT